MKNIKIQNQLLLCACVSFISLISNAQNGFTPIERVVFDKALTTIEDYEVLSAMSDDDSYYSFMELFTTPDVTIYNDLLGLASTETLTVKQYSDLLKSNASSVQVFVSDIKKDKIWYDNDGWKVQYSFDKIISYNNKCGINFSSNDYYGEKYHLATVMAFDETKKVCKITSITGKVMGTQRLSDEFYTFKKTANEDDNLKYNGKELTFNRYRQSFLDNYTSEDMFTYPDPDVSFKPLIDSDCRIISSIYKARRWTLKLHYDIGMGEPYYIDEQLTYTGSSSNSLGLDLGYTFPSKSKMKVGIFWGVGMTNSTLEMGYDYGTIQMSYSTNQDVTDLSYTRCYQGLNLFQTYKLTDVTIPVYMDFQFPISRIVSMYFDLGAKVNYNIIHEVSETRGSAYVYGIYPTLGNLRMDEHWGYNGFGQQTYNDENVAKKDLEDAKSLTIDGFSGVGVRVKIPTTSLSVDLGMNYQYGIMNVYETSNKLSLSPSDTSNALVYNEINGLNSVEKVHNLIQMLDEVKRKQLRLHLGLILKF